MTGRRLIHGACAVVVAVAWASAPAWASTSDEARQGQALAGRLEAGTTTCSRLTTPDFERVGEYVVARMSGSPPVHAAMDDRMRSMLGASDTERMHVLTGRRYAGCGGQGPGASTGTGMMGASSWGRMLSSPTWSWMRDGRRRHMSAADWHRVGDEWMGPGMMRASGHHGVLGWWAIPFLGLTAFLTAGVVWGLLTWRSGRRIPTA